MPREKVWKEKEETSKSRSLDSNTHGHRRKEEPEKDIERMNRRTLKVVFLKAKLRRGLRRGRHSMPSVLLPQVRKTKIRSH